MRPPHQPPLPSLRQRASDLIRSSRTSLLEIVSDAAKAAVLRDGERHLLRVERAFGVKIQSRDPGFTIEGGEPEAHRKAITVLTEMVRIAQDAGDLEAYVVDLLVREPVDGPLRGDLGQPILYDARGQAVRPRTEGQHRLVEASRSHEMVFAIGPAGTGKTYLAIAMAVAALQRREVDRLVLVRPAVEAGEELGFLPGDLNEKIAPYLQPMTDALQELLPRVRYKECMESGIIEMAPLAYMRGRTLKRCFVLLDEAQNATIPQMRMFLTRLGIGSRAIVTGDPTQVDLHPPSKSGFEDACRILAKVGGIAQIRLQSKDQMRHPLVQAIIDAYDSRSSVPSETKEFLK